MRPSLPPPNRSLVLVAVLLAGVVALGASLGAVASTETRYSEMGREMCATGDGVVPRFDGAPLLEKPPWVYWVTAASFWAFGVNDVAPRVPSAVAAVLVLLVVAGAARRFSRAAGETEAEASARGRLAALALATMPSFLVQSIAVSIDIWLVLSTTVAGFCLLEADRAGGRPALRWTLCLHACFGFGMVAKGPLTWVLTFGAAAVVSALRRDARLLRPFVHPLGLLLFAAITLPWYLAIEARLPGVLGTLVRTRLFGAFGARGDFHSHSWWFAWLPLVGTFPWLAALFPSIGSLRRAGRWMNGPGLVALALALAAPVFFTFSPSRLLSYASPAYPWIAFLIAVGAPAPGSDPRTWLGVNPAAALGATWRRETSRAAISMAIVAVLAVAGWAAAGKGLLPDVPAFPIDPFSLVVACAGAVAAVVVAVPRKGGRFFGTPVSRAAAVVLPFLVVLGAVALNDPPAVGACKPLWQAVERERRPGEALGVALDYEGDWGLFPWYSREEVTTFGYPSRRMVVAPEEHRPDLFRPLSELRPWFSSPERRWLLVRKRDVGKYVGGLPMRVVAEANTYAVLSNRPAAGAGN